MKRHLTSVIFILIFIAGLSLLLYPAVSDWWNRMHQTRAITAYAEAAAELDDAEYAQILSDAHAYNETLAASGGSIELPEEKRAVYEAQLDIAGQGIMGYVEIPKISCHLPIYHGTSEGVLQTAVGHLEGTSLPVGGASTHSVLSGHRGLPSARLFTDLDQMTVGDQFMVCVLDEIMTYEVDQILVVLPEETEALAIVPGEDLCTLVTCTPYGVNSHRMLVRGRRMDVQTEGEAERITADAMRIETPLVVSAAMALMIPGLLLLVLHYRHGRRLRRKSGFLLTFALVLSLVLTPVLPAFAREMPDITDKRDYSIKVMMVYDGKTVEGGAFDAYRVGEIVTLRAPAKASEAPSQTVETTGGETYRFWPTDPLVQSMGLAPEEIERIHQINRNEPEAESRLNEILSDKLNGSELNGIETAEQKEKLAQALAAYVMNPTDQAADGFEDGDEGISGRVDQDTGNGGGDNGPGEVQVLWGDNHITADNADGVATFEDLSTGLYLFTQNEEQASPGYYPVEPFLVSVPVYDSEYNYHVEAFPNDHEVKIYVKFRLRAMTPPPPPVDPPPVDPPPVDPPSNPDPDPDPDPMRGPDPIPYSDPDPGQQEIFSVPDTGEPAPFIPWREEAVQTKLPQTGQLNWPVPVLMASGAAIALLGTAIRLWGENEEMEENGEAGDCDHAEK